MIYHRRRLYIQPYYYNVFSPTLSHPNPKVFSTVGVFLTRYASMKFRHAGLTGEVQAKRNTVVITKGMSKQEVARAYAD